MTHMEHEGDLTHGTRARPAPPASHPALVVSLQHGEEEKSRPLFALSRSRGGAALLHTRGYKVFIKKRRGSHCFSDRLAVRAPIIPLLLSPLLPAACVRGEDERQQSSDPPSDKSHVMTITGSWEGFQNKILFRYTYKDFDLVERCMAINQNNKVQ